MSTQISSEEGERGTLLKRVEYGNQPVVYHIWKPADLYDISSSKSVASNSVSDYEDFVFISHVEHFEHYKVSQKNRSFRPNQLSYMSNSHFHYKQNLNVKVVWFGPRQNPNDHNFYGNVAYKIPMTSFMRCMKKLSINVYFLEIVDFISTSASRILFSYKEYDDLELYYPDQKGGVWYENESGEHFKAFQLKRWNSCEDSRGCPHELEIILELQDDDYKEVFEACDVEAVDHSEANEPRNKVCKKYGSSKCPSDWNKDDTGEKIKSFMNGNLDSTLESDSKINSPIKRMKL